MSSTLNFSLKKLTLKAFWSKVILLQSSVGTELNSLYPTSSIEVNCVSTFPDKSTLPSTLISPKSVIFSLNFREK
jgi:hypothetical protein